MHMFKTLILVKKKSFQNKGLTKLSLTIFFDENLNSLFLLDLLN